MIIKTATFEISNSDYKKCPTHQKIEIAFIGRSNVGKSSLINMLTNHQKLAKISGSPGKTQLINHFLINDTWYLVDLPGYGFAKVSIAMRKKFEEMIRLYILKRKELTMLFVLIDIRHDAQNVDLEFIQWLGESGIPFGLIFTKSDKLSKAKAVQSVDRYKKELLKAWEELPPVFISSSVDKTGHDAILDFIDSLLIG